jgi:hypothetical protein
MFDFAMRVVMMRHASWSKFWMLHESTSMWVLIFKLCENRLSLTAHWIAFTRLIKLLRYGQILTFFKNKEIVYK